MKLPRRIAGAIFLAAFAVGATLPHHHSLTADLYESGFIQQDHDHVLSSHDPHSRSTHFHAILGFEHDACAACHGIRGLGRPAAALAFHGAGLAGRFDLASVRLLFHASPRSASSRAPPASF
jgi:hypothetical protein